jgi:hypothetical protein
MDGLRISEHVSESGRWRIASLAPNGRLAANVDAFHAYHEQDTMFRRRRELPDGSAVLIFNLGKELRVEHPAGTLRAFGAGRAFFGGASATHAVTETDGAQTGAQIKFSLLGARLILGRPPGELGDALVDPSEAFGSGAADWGKGSPRRVRRKSGCCFSRRPWRGSFFRRRRSRRVWRSP